MSQTNNSFNNEEMFFTVCNEEGTETECEILLTFEDKATGKNYIVYTDNTKDEAGNFRVFANQFDPNADASALLPIEEEHIWSLIAELLEDLGAEDDAN